MGSSSTVDVKRAKEIGIDLYLEKPLSEEKILKALGVALE
jgi:AmiR/NasT family two-component response regulator